MDVFLRARIHYFKYDSVKPKKKNGEGRRDRGREGERERVREGWGGENFSCCGNSFQ